MLSTTGWVIFGLLLAVQVYRLFSEWMYTNTSLTWKLIHTGATAVGAVVVYYILSMVFSVQPVVGGRRR